MITKEIIDQINYLARKSKTIGLSPDEKIAQAKLRRQYLDGIRQRVTATLEQVERPKEHHHGCDCGCHSKKPLA